MDQQIRNNLRCKMPNCNQVALGLNPYNNEWICGICLKKLEDKVQIQRRKQYEIFEKEIGEENDRQNTS